MYLPIACKKEKKPKLLKAKMQKDNAENNIN